MTTVTRLKRLGFDQSRYNPGSHSWSVRCSACASLVINGCPVHESGCPNEPKEKTDGHTR